MPKAAKPRGERKAVAPKTKPAPKPRARAGRSADATAHRRTLFIAAYLSNGHNATEAAIVAGCPPSSAKRQGYRMRHEPAVDAAIAARARHLAEAAEMTVENWARELRGIAFGSLADLYDVDGQLLAPPDLPARTLASLASVKVRGGGEKPTVTEYKLWDKVGALAVMARHLGLFERDNSQRAENLSLVVRLV